MFPEVLSTQASIVVFGDELPLRKKPLVCEVRRVAREELEGTLKELLTVTIKPAAPQCMRPANTLKRFAH